MASTLHPAQVLDRLNTYSGPDVFRDVVLPLIKRFDDVEMVALGSERDRFTTFDGQLFERHPDGVWVVVCDEQPPTDPPAVVRPYRPAGTTGLRAAVKRLLWCSWRHRWHYNRRGRTGGARLACVACRNRRPVTGTRRAAG